MKHILRKVFAPLLNIFEQGDENYAYKPLNRTILLVVGVLFAILASAVTWLSPQDELGFLIPLIVFGGASLVCLVVGLLGSDKAVAKIWGGK
ncbi:hypothetical protein DS2_01788 [Catenovulum agarivorans DS-2]|uniref:Uncharacterized protein n=1 Tax=Catenovulum agarivorans DS-2 TaxID=1328313 RepID=W7QS87_9ALTE|nr:hypothetical protein [Catenovulum agarivorans]EWH11877.1 hypothetical protein DS2_01788 [Catenovulum agarivorans DS-2]